ncbi:MAG: tungsten ABC transporter substrate-binding protein [Candidatus Edwardsbacteria bacterium RIFOXYD12_FULL_50_11]|uniref:Tungsten ABC transporter substrate-binding protein n=1 Tax=Candidatus Edwardsbacteria bacterium GWF2_54_11 TaxID=1817851 RepID=A0A1F5R4L3_9BACT|nr:MAG: tungsten ABC transporter substrate-binding protein [Candidatus Edwardsbacteria bacterium RifOxyC12_full_54_24]OGF06682.1 MAG: tungsten ABC transporter substrate-binding protein [Candidatus Edwardsbacteria bacterium RifOxyA12_full_54_48]OGF09404.1 MAG: tungsten ABC transporter substrate-binding protein [Candidatus Edwardsbacteria bacterium GWF2_54_11]OGF10633.1 MAG: tungsten ABC transporter substrate-binding protein [Candidatus Edwardsbacteria bacterium GWE2_54_12]OGF15414.1 MAG: tungste
MKRFATLSLSLLLVLSLLVPVAQAKDKPKLVLATTTSTMDSGLLDFLVPIFEKENGCKVQIIAVGTGAAIRYGKDGNADIVMVHDPVAEEVVVKEGFFVERKYLMYNDFVIVGPAEDPAGIKGLASAAEALKKIEASQATFVSRADQSGTHKKEERMWAVAGLSPKGSWYLQAGAGMEAVLRIANEKRAYCLTDRGTYLAHQKEFELPILTEGDQELFNPYHIMLVAPAKYPFVNYSLAKKFSDFLTSERGQKLIAEYGVDKYGQPLFYPAAEKK